MVQHRQTAVFAIEENIEDGFSNQNHQIVIAKSSILIWVKFFEQTRLQINCKAWKIGSANKQKDKDMICRFIFIKSYRSRHNYYKFAVQKISFHLTSSRNDRK